MFINIVTVCLMLILFLAGGAALYMGLFKSHRESTSFAKKAITGVVSYGLSAVAWFLAYGYHYSGW